MGLGVWSPQIPGTVRRKTDGSIGYFGGFKWKVTNSITDRRNNNRSQVVIAHYAGRLETWANAWRGTGNERNSTVRLNNNTPISFPVRFDFRGLPLNTAYDMETGGLLWKQSSIVSFTINHNADRKAQIRIRTYFLADLDSFWDITTDSTFWLPETPRIDPGTPGFTTTYLDEDGGNPETTGKSIATVRLTATSTNPDNFYTLAILDVTTNTTVVLKSGKVKNLTHDINVSDSYYDKTWKYRARVYGGTNPSVNRYTSIANVFIEKPDTPFFYHDGETYHQVQKIWYHDGTEYKKVKRNFYNNGGVWV